MVYGMKYAKCREAVFLDRPNRFVAHVEIDGQTETVHVKNTGRCRELLLPGSRVILAESDNPARKTKYDLVTVWKEGLGWVNIDSQAPNTVVKEWLEKGTKVFPGLSLIRPEYTFGQSRVDFYLECQEEALSENSSGIKKILMEVKGCTLERDGIGYFPDAPTERGVKHLHELAGAVHEGYECYLAFVIAMPKVSMVYPNVQTHAAFGEALEKAQEAGVKVLYLTTEVTPEGMVITHE